MRIKDSVKAIIGVERARCLRGWALYFKSLPKIKDVMGAAQVLNDAVKGTKIIECKNSHVFCGYYDIAPDNPVNPNELLVHVLPKGSCGPDDKISLCVADAKTGAIKEYATSAAWCWQMGSRLRWSKRGNAFYYNDFNYETGDFCCRLFNTGDHSTQTVSRKALYDISRDESFGIATDFVRLGRLRPGYGYVNIPDTTSGDKSPRSCGLEYVSLLDGTSRMLVSVEELSSILPDSKSGEGYINHISISPSGKRIMFFYIWTTTVSPGWRATLWIYDLGDGSLKCLDSVNQVSHYTWIDDESLLVTGIDADCDSVFYRQYSCTTQETKTLDDAHLQRDGHPTLSRKFDGFYSDTYPDSDYCQTLFMFDREKGYQPLLKVLHDPRMYGEKRCDLHPHYFRSTETVAIDTTYSDNKRSVLLVEVDA